MVNLLAQAAPSFLDRYPALEEFINSLAGTSDEALGIDVILLRLALAAALGWIIGRIYRQTFTGTKFTASLPDTHMLLSLGGAMIWLVVGDNLVRAFGLAGTIGLIRYRTVVRDPKDTTILLFSMIIGMACGLGNYPVAAIGAVVVATALLWLHVGHQRKKAEEARKSRDLLSLFGDSDDTPPETQKKPPKP